MEFIFNRVMNYFLFGAAYHDENEKVMKTRLSEDQEMMKARLSDP